jgi:hypothetical protein
VPLGGIKFNKILVLPETQIETGVNGAYPWGRHVYPSKGWEKSNERSVCKSIAAPHNRTDKNLVPAFTKLRLDGKIIIAWKIKTDSTFLTD